MLDVLWDDRCERLQDWCSAVVASTQELFADSPVTGPPAALHMVKSTYRTAGNPELWYEKFLRDKLMEGGDHISNELRTLCDSLWASRVLRPSELWRTGLSRDPVPQGRRDHRSLQWPAAPELVDSSLLWRGNAGRCCDRSRAEASEG